jgi:class 3 adenylate cyclase
MKKQKDKSNFNDVFKTEFEIRDKSRKIIKDKKISKTKLIKEYTFLSDGYKNLLRNTVKMTKITDSMQRKILQKNDELEVEKNRSEKAYLEIEKLNEISKKINETVSLDDILSMMGEYLKINFDLDNIWLQLVDKKNNELYTYKWILEKKLSDDSMNWIKNLRIPLNSEGGTFWLIYKRKRPFYMRRMFGIPSKINKKIVDKLQIYSILQVPLIIQDRVIGMLNIAHFEREMHLSRGDIVSITRFAEQIAGALYNSNLLKEVESERQKSDKLLLNILPSKVANELKENGEVKPKFYESVTIMFTDIKGFTQMALQIPDSELVAELDRTFNQFDFICDRHHIEKLKTIGDAYMCAGGLPDKNNTHPLDICLTALEIQNFMNEIGEIKKKISGKTFWKIRLGIHTGPAVAGIIGKNKFAYDVWGNTVNVASRMESLGKVGQINLSENTYSLVKNYFICEYRGEVEIKHKGQMKMYFLTRLKPEFSRDKKGIIPNEDFVSIYQKQKNGTNVFK